MWRDADPALRGDRARCSTSSRGALAIDVEHDDFDLECASETWLWVLGRRRRCVRLTWHERSARPVVLGLRREHALNCATSPWTTSRPLSFTCLRDAARREVEERPRHRLASDAARLSSVWSCGVVWRAGGAQWGAVARTTGSATHAHARPQPLCTRGVLAREQAGQLGGRVRYRSRKKGLTRGPSPLL